MIRKGIAEGLQSEWDPGDERLYKVYAESVRNLGTLVFSAKYLRILREEFTDDCSVLMITCRPGRGRGNEFLLSR